MAPDAGARRHDRRAVRGRHHLGLSAPSGCRAVPERTGRAVSAIRTGAAPRQDPPAGVRSLCGRESAEEWRGQTRDLRLPRLHAHLWEEAEWKVHGAAADDAEAVAG